MKCFSCGDRREHSSTRTPRWTWGQSTNSRSSEAEVKRSESDFNSQEVSQASTESSVGRNNFPIIPQRESNLREFTVSELKSATKNFSRSVMIGEGGFGGVFKGTVKTGDNSSQKLEVAVKQLSRRGMQGHKEWVTEVNVLGVVEHPNLVKLLGYCADDDERGIQRLLVYEYMMNGSVDDHLSPRSDNVLPWATRLRIAQDTARGLAYLHEEMDFQIIFRDFKSSNILLDEQWNAKLSDFGLARLGPTEGLTHVSTAVVGTMGYAAPEYLKTGRLTSKNDVWSYGVFLYELITGRGPLDRNRPKSEQKLLEWVKPYLSDAKRFQLIVDPRLERKPILKSAYRLTTVANRCLVRNAKSRPKMSEVLEMVNKIVEASDGREEPRARQRVSQGPEPEEGLLLRRAGRTTKGGLLNSSRGRSAGSGAESPSKSFTRAGAGGGTTSVESGTNNKRRLADFKPGEVSWFGKLWTAKVVRTC